MLTRLIALTAAAVTGGFASGEPDAAQARSNTGAVIGGIAAGAIIGGAIANANRGYYAGPGYYAPAPGYYDAAAGLCRASAGRCGRLLHAALPVIPAGYRHLYRI